MKSLESLDCSQPDVESNLSKFEPVCLFSVSTRFKKYFFSAVDEIFSVHGNAKCNATYLHISHPDALATAQRGQ